MNAQAHADGGRGSSIDASKATTELEHRLHRGRMFARGERSGRDKEGEHRGRVRELQSLSVRASDRSAQESCSNKSCSPPLMTVVIDEINAATVLPRGRS